MGKNLIYFSILICVFPFTPKIFNSDLQPFYFIAILSVFIINSEFFWKDSSLQLMLIVAMMIIFYKIRFGYEFIDSIRSYFVYLTPILVLFLMKNKFIEKKQTIKIFEFGLIVYVLYGTSQYIGYDFFGTYDVERIAYGRGVNSLMPEPSMFGFTLTMLMLGISSEKHKIPILIIIYLFGIFICGSASSILAASPLIAYLLYKNKYLMIIFIPPIIYYSFNFLELDIAPRLISLISSGDIYNILISDFSINERVGHLYYIFSNPIHFLVGGSDGWGKEYAEFIHKSNTIFFFGSDINNILSGIGSIIYDGGVFGIIYLLLFFRQTKYLQNNIFIKISWLFIALQSVSFSMPLLTMCLALNNLEDKKVKAKIFVKKLR